MPTRCNHAVARSRAPRSDVLSLPTNRNPQVRAGFLARAYVIPSGATTIWVARVSRAKKRSSFFVPVWPRQTSTISLNGRNRTGVSAGRRASSIGRARLLFSAGRCLRPRRLRRESANKSNVRQTRACIVIFCRRRLD